MLADAGISIDRDGARRGWRFADGKGALRAGVPGRAAALSGGGFRWPAGSTAWARAGWIGQKSFSGSAVSAGTLVGVGGAGVAAAGGGAFAGEAAKLGGDEVDLAVERAGLVAEAVGGFHDVHPDGQREGGAVAALDGFFRLVEADPDGAGELRGVAGEPGVLEIIGGAGFAAAGFVEAEALDGGGGAAGGDFLEDVGNRPRGAAAGGLDRTAAGWSRARFRRGP